ncbi:hypothetical protein Q5752_006328 [Cryptotrichosporon argae]
MAFRANPATWFRFSLAANVLAVMLVLFMTLPDTIVSKDYQMGVPAFLSDVAHYAGVGKIKGGAGADETSALAGSNIASSCTLCKVAPEACKELGADFLDAAIPMRVSGGHGLPQPNTGDQLSNMHRRAFEHLNERFPSPWAVEHAAEHAAAPPNDVSNSFGATIGWFRKDQAKALGDRKNAFINGAFAGTGSNYFSACYRERIPEDVDIVMVEFAINDEFQIESVASYERLIRALLDLPSKPAVINLHSLSVASDLMARGGELQYGVASFYDLPLVTLRNPLLPRLLNNHSLAYDWYRMNGRQLDASHLNAYGHERVGDLIIAYIEQQLCEMDAIETAAAMTDVDELYPVKELPRLMLTMKYDQTTVLPDFRPTCMTAGSPRSPLVPSAQTGWREWAWGDKPFWIADVPGSLISFDFPTTVGSVKLYYQRSAQFGLGSVSCWVDNYKDHAVRIDGTWERPFNIGQEAVIMDRLSPGNHTLWCQLLDETLDPNGGKEFRIIGVFRCIKLILPCCRCRS